MNTEHLQKESGVKVADHLAEKRGIFQMVLSWKLPDGKRERKSISTSLQVKGNKKRAEEMLREKCREHELLLSNNPTAQTILFADFMEEWLEAMRHNVKTTTFGGYQMNVQRAIVPWFRERGITLQDLPEDDIHHFYADQLKRIKATSVHKFHANISKALKYAVERKMIPHSVMDKVKRPKKERFVGKFLKQSEVVALFEAVKGHRLELGVMLGAFYDLRRGEIVSLKWDAIDFEANTITIEHTVTVATVDGERVVIADDTTKSKSSYRTLPLVPQFKAKLLEVREQQEHYKKLCGSSYDKKEGHYVYVNELGKRINPGYLTSVFPDFMEKHGFQRMRFHDLRHPYVKLGQKIPCRLFNSLWQFTPLLIRGTIECIITGFPNLIVPGLFQNAYHSFYHYSAVICHVIPISCIIWLLGFWINNETVDWRVKIV